MLYRLDYFEDGRTVAAVHGADIGILPTGDILCRHMTTARQRAIQAAAASGRDVLITRIDSAGRLKPSIVIGPDGKGKQPPGVKSSGRPHVEGTACFCDNCRASRRA